MSFPQLPEPSGSEPSGLELSTAKDPRLGVAYAVSVRSEGGGENSVHQVVVTYRLRRWGFDGRELPLLQVEMRGRHLQGMIADGDLIQSPGPLPASGVVQLETVANLTTGGPVVLMKPRTSAVAIVVLVVVLVFFVAVVGIIVVGILGASQ